MRQNPPFFVLLMLAAGCGYSSRRAADVEVPAGTIAVEVSDDASVEGEFVPEEPPHCGGTLYVGPSQGYIGNHYVPFGYGRTLIMPLEVGNFGSDPETLDWIEFAVEEDFHGTVRDLEIDIWNLGERVATVRGEPVPGGYHFDLGLEIAAIPNPGSGYGFLLWGVVPEAGDGIPSGATFQTVLRAVTPEVDGRSVEVSDACGEVPRERIEVEYGHTIEDDRLYDIPSGMYEITDPYLYFASGGDWFGGQQPPSEESLAFVLAAHSDLHLPIMNAESLVWVAHIRVEGSFLAGSLGGAARKLRVYRNGLIPAERIVEIDLPESVADATVQIAYPEPDDGTRPLLTTWPGDASDRVFFSLDTRGAVPGSTLKVSVVDVSWQPNPGVGRPGNQHTVRGLPAAGPDITF